MLLLFGLLVLRSEILKLMIALSREMAWAMGTASTPHCVKAYGVAVLLLSESWAKRELGTQITY